MKSYIKILFSVLVLAAVIVGGLFYNNLKASNKPPTLSFLSNADEYQATVLSRNNGFLRFDANDVARWDDPSGRSVDLQANTHFYYSDDDIKIEDLIDSIKPILYNEIVILYYSPDENKTGLKQGEGFYTYPDISEFFVGGSGSADVYGFSNEENFTIPAYRPFMIVSKMNSKIYSKHANIYEEDDKAPNGYDFENPLSGSTTGWVLALVEDDDLSFLEDHQNILESVYLQSGENDFDEIDLEDLADTDAEGYYILWLQTKEADPQCNDDIDNDHDGDIDYGEDNGCSSSNDNNESDDPVPGAPVVTSPSDKVLSYNGGTITVSFPNQTGLTYVGGITLYKSGTTTPDVVNNVTENGSTVTISYLKSDLEDISDLEDGDEFTLTIPEEAILSGGEPALTADVTFEFTIEDVPVIYSFDTSSFFPTCPTIPAITGSISAQGGAIIPLLALEGGTMTVDFAGALDPSSPEPTGDFSLSGSSPISLKRIKFIGTGINMVKQNEVEFNSSVLEIPYDRLSIGNLAKEWHYQLVIPAGTVVYEQSTGEELTLDEELKWEFEADIGKPAGEGMCGD